MKINSLKTISNYSTYTKIGSISKRNNNSANSQQSFKGLGLISLSVNYFKNKEKDFSERFFMGFGKPSAETCENIIKNHSYTLNRAYKLIENNRLVNLKETPNTTAKGGYNLKKYFDEKYGDNYRIISIGTSTAPLAQAANYLGAEVIFLPATGLGGLTEEEKRKALNTRNANILLEYFKTKVPKDDNKVNVIIDYTNSGKSLEAITQLLKEGSGLDKNNFEPYKLTDILIKFSKENPKKKNSLTEEDIQNIYLDCREQASEYISNVPHFVIIDDMINREWNEFENYSYIASRNKDFNKVFSEFENYSTELARAYDLCMYNELKKMGLIENK